MADENRVNFFTSNTFRPISDEEIEEIGKSVNPGEVGDLYGSMTEDDIDEITGIVTDSTEDDFHDETGGTTKGLNPCCYETIWNIRKENDGFDYKEKIEYKKIEYFK